MEVKLPILLCVVITAGVTSAKQYGTVRATRTGDATDTNSCQGIRKVPEWLTKEAVMKADDEARFYTKYTEAYGIPVLGREKVPDEAMRRACYILRFLLAGNSKVRQAFYTQWGRIALKDVKESRISMPEDDKHNSLHSLTPMGSPVKVEAHTSPKGGHVLKCYGEDTMLNQITHGVYFLGAAYAIDDWTGRVERQFKRIEGQNKWFHTYSTKSPVDYFAQGVQSYYDVNVYSPYPNGVHGSISTRDKLKNYDSTLYNMIQEVFPCDNDYLKMCETTREEEDGENLTMDCDLGKGREVSGKSTFLGDPFFPVEKTWKIQREDECFDVNSDCASRAKAGECKTNPYVMLPGCKNSCGLCNADGDCVDYQVLCAHWARNGECTKNPNTMLSDCPKSCGLCNDNCVDTSPNCATWALDSQCSKDPSKMWNSCRKSCHLCTDLAESKGMNDYDSTIG